jgi:hypothetical protein
MATPLTLPGTIPDMSRCVRSHTSRHVLRYHSADNIPCNQTATIALPLRAHLQRDGTAARRNAILHPPRNLITLQP